MFRPSTVNENAHPKMGVPPTVFRFGQLSNRESQPRSSLYRSALTPPLANRKPATEFGRPWGSTAAIGQRAVSIRRRRTMCVILEMIQDMGAPSFLLGDAIRALPV